MDRSKMYKIIMITVIVILLIVGLCVAYYFVFGNKKSYSAIETIMENAAEEYYDDHAEELPTEAGATVIISVDTLVSGEYMDSIATLSKDEKTSCTGEVRVMNNSGKYQYVANIDCGDTYQTKNFKDYILENSKQVYDFENTDEQIVINAATLKSIQSTWDNTNKVQLAKQQIQKIINEKPVKTQKYDFQFIINDKNVYHALSDFHSDEARQLFNQFRQKEKDIESLEAMLIELRETYQQATSEAKSQMVPSILEKEKRVKELHNEINKLTEQIRNTEINALK